MIRRPWTASAAAVAAAAAVCTALAGCRDRIVTSPSTSATPSPTLSAAPGNHRSADAAEAADRAAVEAAYRRFWVVEASFASQYPPGRWRAVLAEVATDPVLTRLVDGAAVQRRQGIGVYGTAVPRPRIPPIRGPNTVRVLDCQDDSQTGQLDTRTGRRLSVGVARAPVTALMIRNTDGAWRVSDVRYLGGRC